MAGRSSSAGRRDSGIAGWLLALIFACLVAGIVTVGTYYYRHYESNYRSQVERQLSAIADLKVSELVLWRKERIGDGAVFLENSSFSGLVRRFFENPREGQAQREILAWLDKFQTAYAYDRVLLLDAQGAIRLSVPADRSSMSATVLRRIPEVLRTGRVTLQDFYRCEHDQRIYLAVLAPILDVAESNRPLGVLVLRIDPEIYLYPFIQRWPTPSLTAETLLVRREYNQVVFLNELLFQKNTALTLRMSLEHKGVPAVEAVLGREGVMEGSDYRGVPVAAALRGIPDSPWSLIARMDTAEVYAPLRAQLRFVVLLISALLLGAAGGVGLIWRQQRARYYRTKYEAAEARARLAAIVEHADDAIIGKNLEGTITSWNAGAERLFGYHAEEIIGQSITRIIPPEEHPREVETLRRLRRGERVEHYEAVRLAKDGSPVDVSLNISPIRDEAGKIIGVAKIARDITGRKRAEEMMRELAARYRALFDKSTDGILIADFETKTFKYANPALCRMLGYTETELRTMGVPDIHPKEAVQRVVAEFEALVRGHKTLAADIPCLRKDDSVVHADVNAIDILVDGRPCSVGFFRDITERKRAEESIRELAARYLALFNENNDGMLVTDVETKKFIHANPAMCRMLGYTEDELRTMGMPDIHPRDALQSVIAKFEAQARGDKTLAEDVPCLRKDGSVVHTDISGVKITVDGRPCNVGFFRDITERKRAEEALRTSEQEFRSLAEAMPQIVWATRADGWNIYFNQRWVDYTGLTLEESYGHGWNTPFHPDDRQRAWDAWQRATKNHDTYALECRLRRADGAYRWWLIRGVPLRNESGEILKWFGTCTDIEDLKQAEEKIKQLNAELEQRVRDRTAELEAANKELEAFSYSVSHDLRAPLRAMDGFSMALLEDCAGRLDETAQDHLRRIRAGSQQMAELIEDLLNLSRESRAEMRRERVDLTVLTHEIAAEFQRTHPDRKVQLVVAPALTADADARMLRLVFNNLLENAWKFTSRCAQARIEVGALEQDGQRIFFVRDNGVGFDMAYAGRLFGAFQRLHTSQEFPGTGIGLAIVQRIIHRHGGRAWAEGAVGQGATFYFTLKGK